jgi:uncharacterized protein YhdP
LGTSDLRIGSANRDSGPFSPEEASAKFSLFMDRSSIKFDSLVLDWNDIELSGTLALENYDTPDLRVITQFDSRPFEFSDVKRILAKGKLPSGIDKFLNAVTRGQVRLSEVRIDGSLRELRDWGKEGGKASVSGSVALTNMDMAVGKAKLPIKGIDLVLSLDGDDLGFEITEGMIRNTRLKEVRGKVTNLFSEPLLTADISASVELADLKELLDLKGKMDVPGFMGRTERLYGEGELSLSLMKRIPGGPTTLKGEIELSRAFISHPRFPLPLSDLTGKVFFTNDTFGFENLQGLFGVSPFRITLTSFNFRDADPPLSLRGNMSLDRRDLTELLPAWLTDRVDFEGSTDMVFRLSGSKQSMDIQTDLDLKDFSYRYNNFYKPLAADGSMKFEAHLVPSNILTIKKLSITHGDMTADAKGNIFLVGPILDLQLRSDDFDIKYLAEFFPRFLTYNPRGGKGSIQFGFTGKPGAIKTQGMVRVEGITADFPVLPRSLYLANAKITYREGVYTWEVDEVITGKSRFYTRGSYRKGAQIPLSMDYKFFSLYLEDISNGNHRNGVEKSENEEQADRTDGHLNDRSMEDTALRRRAGMFLYPFSADIEAENFFINDVRLWALRTRLESGNGYWNFKDLMFNLAGGKFNGSLMVNGLSPSGSEFDMMVDLIGVDLEKLIEQIRPETDVISGTLSLKGQIQGDKLTLEGLRKSVSGRIILRLNDGFIKKFKVLAAVSRLLNFPQLIASTGKEGSGLGKGLPYRSITGGLDFNEGIMYTDDLLMDGPSVKMSSVGSVDFVAKKYDMTVALQPLGDLGNMVGKIPLVGKLIAGSDSSLTTTFFKVGGEFGNPKPEVTK